jgi:hypothetical protein
MDVLDQLLDAIKRIGRLHLLLGEHVQQVVVVLLGKTFRRGMLDRDAGLLGLADRAAAGAVHIGEQLVLAARQIGLVVLHHPEGEAEVRALLRRDIPVGDLVVQAAELAKGELLEPPQRLDARDVGVEIEPHVGGVPAAERAAEDRHAAAAKQDAAEEACGLAILLDLGDHDLAAGVGAHVLQPAPALHQQAIAEAVQDLPVYLPERQPVEAEHAHLELDEGSPGRARSDRRVAETAMPGVPSDTPGPFMNC